MRGRLITIEGLDGSGKTTLADALVDALRRRARRWCCCASPAASSSPSASARWSRTRRWRSIRAPRRCSTRRRARSSWPSACEPALAAGTWVRAGPLRRLLAGLPGRRPRAGRSRRWPQINHFGTGGLAPDRTLLLRADAATRDGAPGVRGEAPDRLEREDGAFFDAIAGAYDALAAAEPERFRVLDAGDGAGRGARRRARRAGRPRRLTSGADGPPRPRDPRRALRARACSRGADDRPGDAGAARRRRDAAGRHRLDGPDRRDGADDPDGPDRRDRADDHGPTGATGATGATGPTGATGTTGPASAAAGGGDGGRDRGLSGEELAAIIAGALVLLALLAWALAWWRAWEPPWLLRWRHAAGEAGWRTGNAWSDFVDWIRLGR